MTNDTNTITRRRLLTVGAAGAAALSCPAVVRGGGRADGPTLIARAAEFLRGKQARDGGWHSETYALLRSGQALTPFVLHAILSVPAGAWSRRRGGAVAAIAFMAKYMDKRGVLGVADPDIVEYPNYSTAYALRCCLRLPQLQNLPDIDKPRDYLIGQQYREANGHKHSAPEYGGWGFGRTVKSTPGAPPEHMDLAHTRCVLQALREAGVQDAELWSRAQRFLRFVQRHPTDARPQPPFDGTGGRADFRPPYDGGFYFSPIVLAANKGRLEPPVKGEPGKPGHPAYYRSYATATCDGVLALLAAGVAKDDERVAAARDWLKGYPRLDYPEGIPADHPEPWGQAVWHYHLAVRAQAYQALDWPGDWRREIIDLLAPEQLADGSFVNRRSPLMKENDPILCTALALWALAACS